MKFAVGCVILAMCFVIPAQPAGAQTAPKGTITGAAPFALGMATADAVAADPTLAPITAGPSGTACTPANSAAYATRVTAPIGGYPYTAELILCFLNGKLGAIYLTWPRGTFQQDTTVWQLATRSLAAQLAASYSPPVLTRRYAVDDDMGAIVEMSDAQGNLATMTSHPSDDPDIALTYMSAAYDQAVNGKRVAVTSY